MMVSKPYSKGPEHMATDKEAPKAVKDAKPAGDENAPEVQVDADTKATDKEDYLVPGEVSTHEGDVIVPAGSVTKNERLFPDEPASPNNPLLAQLVSVPGALADRVNAAKDKTDDKADSDK